MLHAYPVLNKRKSIDICNAFMLGCGGVLVNHPIDEIRPGPAFFYGVDKSNEHLWKQAKDREFYYCDNSYFDSTRQEYFRVTKNALQHTGMGITNEKRFNELEIPILPRVTAGRHIVVCPQSDHFMENIAGFNGSWTESTMEWLRKNSQRPVRLRLWSADKGKLASTLAYDLEEAHALVTWSSAAAVTAILAGVPAFCSRQSAAAPVANLELSNMEHPYFFHEATIRAWAGVLADNQWTLLEMAKGIAWGMLND